MIHDSITPQLALFGFGAIEVVVVAAVVLLLFGTRLPMVARSLGQSITEFKKGVKEADSPAEETDKIK